MLVILLWGIDFCHFRCLRLLSLSYGGARLSLCMQNLSQSAPEAHRKEWDGRKHRNVVEAVGFLLKECVFKLSFSGIFFFIDV